MPSRLSIVLLAVMAVATIASVAGCQKGGDRQPADRASVADSATPDSAAAKPVYVASILPLACILDGIVGERGEVHVLLPAGVSPHTYEPKPSDAAQAQGCVALFYVAPVLDGWAARHQAPAKIAVFDYVPPESRLPLVTEHRDVLPEHEADLSQDQARYDPHFWTDPLLVRSILPKLAGELSRLSPAETDTYHRNAEAFSAELTQLDGEVRGVLAPYAGEPVLLFHPSMRYFLKAYSLKFAGAVEVAPGKEPSPADLAEIIELARASHLKALFGEHQLSKKSVDAVSEVVGLPVYLLDPLGSGQSAADYLTMTQHNTQALATALGSTPSNM